MTFSTHNKTEGQSLRKIILALSRNIITHPKIIFISCQNPSCSGNCKREKRYFQTFKNKFQNGSHVEFCEQIFFPKKSSKGGKMVCFFNSPIPMTKVTLTKHMLHVYYQRQASHNLIISFVSQLIQ